MGIKYECQQHDGLKWYTFASYRDLDAARTEFRGALIAFRERCHRIVLGSHVIELSDVRAPSPARA